MSQISAKFEKSQPRLTQLSMTIGSSHVTKFQTQTRNFTQKSQLCSIICDKLYSNMILNLNPNEINYLTNILNDENDQTILKIEQDIRTILADGKITIEDIPTIFELVHDIYLSDLKGKMIDDIGVANILEFTFDTILESGIFPIPKSQIKSIENILGKFLDLTMKNFKLEQELRNTHKCCFGLFKW